MDYRLEIAEETVEMAMTPGKDGTGVMAIGGQETPVSWQMLPGGMIRLVIGGRAHVALYRATAEGGWVHLGGRAFCLKDLDKAPARRKGSGADGPGEVTPPMPAVVVRITCEVGQRVEKGKGLVVVSAMKMETTLAAPYDGVVTAVNCQVDGKVMPGDILVDIEADAPAEEAA